MANDKQTMQEKLGYPKDTKLLIIHADDLGSCHAANAGTFDAHERGSITSASVMMPTGWVSDVKLRQSKRPMDLGVHVTLNSEWSSVRWRPLTSGASLVDEFGYFWATRREVQEKAESKHVKKEVRRQIELAQKMGLNPSHIDTHMAGHFLTGRFLKLVIKLSEEYRLPTLLVKPGKDLELAAKAYKLPYDEIVKLTLAAEKRGHFILDSLKTDSVGFGASRIEDYIKYIRNIPYGVSQLILHPAEDSVEVRRMLCGADDPSSDRCEHRFQDYKFALSDELKQVIKSENIKLINWNDIRKVVYP